MPVQPRPTEVKGSCSGQLVKHKINKLELQIGLECGEAGASRHIPGGSSSRQPALPPPCEGSVWLQGSSHREETPELRLVPLGCCRSV